jgi:hypothetical protein
LSAEAYEAEAAASAGVIGSGSDARKVGLDSTADQESSSVRVFIGLDVSLAKMAICVVDPDGIAQWQG